MKSIITLTLLLAFCFNAKSHIYFKDEIKFICDSKLITIPSSKSDTIILSNTLIKKQKIAYHIIICDSKVAHAGIALFSDSLLRQPNNLVFRFIERKFLAYAISDNIIDIQNDLKLSNAYLSYNGIFLGESGFENYSKILVVLSTFTNCDIFTDSSKIAISIKAKEGEVEFIFKKNFFTISGLNKIEADSLLFNELVTFNSDKGNFPKITGSGDLIKFNDTIFTVKENDYMNILTGNYYVVKADSNFRPLFNSEYPAKSFITSIIRPESIAKQINVLIDHKQYKKSKSENLILTDLICCLKNDHEMFFGLEDSVNSLSGTLIAYNKQLNYIHMLYFATTKEMLFSSHPEYFCKLYSFIPSDNIKNLFSNAEGNNVTTGKKIK